MLRKSFSALAALTALAIAACGGGNNGPNVPAAPTPGGGSGVPLSTSQQSVAVPGLAGTTMTLQLPSGTGTVTVSSSTTPPSPLPALQGAARKNPRNASPAPATTNVPQLYITITATSAVTVNGFPGMTVVFPSAPSAPVYEAEWNGTNYVTVGDQATISGTKATINGKGLKPPMAIASGSSMYLALYTGYVVPSPTPSPTPTATPTPGVTPTPKPTATPVIQNGNFANGLTGWTPCSYQHTGFTGPVNASPTPQSSATQSPTFTTSPELLASLQPQVNVVTPPVNFNPHFLNQTPANLGTAAALLGSLNSETKGAAGICQTFTVPADRNQLSLDVYEGGQERAMEFADQEADIIDQSTQQRTQTIFAEENCFNDPADLSTIDAPSSGCQLGGTSQFTDWQGGYWSTHTFDMSPLAGRSVTLFIGIWDEGNSTGATAFDNFMFVDDVQLTAPGGPSVFASHKRLR